jgi:Ketoacyl-synthetase C-terminal extension
VRPWQGPAPRFAGVSSFGLGGSNAHAILESAPPRPLVPAADGRHRVTLAAPTPELLDIYRQDLLEHLVAFPDTDAADVAFTLGRRVGRFPSRLAVSFSNREALMTGLTSAPAAPPAAVEPSLLAAPPAVTGRTIVLPVPRLRPTPASLAPIPADTLAPAPAPGLFVPSPATLAASPPAAASVLLAQVALMRAQLQALGRRGAELGPPWRSDTAARTKRGPHEQARDPRRSVLGTCAHVPRTPGLDPKVGRPHVPRAHRARAPARRSNSRLGRRRSGSRRLLARPTRLRDHPRDPRVRQNIRPHQPEAPRGEASPDY